MKKFFFIAILVNFTLTLNAQKTEFSVVGGISNAAVAGDVIGQAFNTGTGLYIGLGSEFRLLEKSSIYSEITYSRINGANYFQLPVLFKYNFAEKYSFLLGPQVAYIGQDIPDNPNISLTKFSIGLSGGLRYDISNKLYTQLRYTYHLNNQYTGPINGLNYNIDYASIGIGFKF